MPPVPVSVRSRTSGRSSKERISCPCCSLSHASLTTPTVYPRYRRKSSIYLSGYRLSPVWACSIYLFRQHIISFWRSHLTLISAILVAARRNESNPRFYAAQRSHHEYLEDCLIGAAGSGPPGPPAYFSRPQSPVAPRLPRDRRGRARASKAHAPAVAGERYGPWAHRSAHYLTAITPYP